MAGGQPSLWTGFLGGGTQAGALPQGILVVSGATLVLALPATDAAHSRDAAAAVDHIASADRVGPEAIATADAGAANGGCRGRAGSTPHKHSWEWDRTRPPFPRTGRALLGTMGLVGDPVTANPVPTGENISETASSMRCP